MNVGAKWAELVTLMPKFAKRSCVRIFRSERTQSTPFDQKLMFWVVSHRLCKMGRTGTMNANVREMKLRLNFSQGTHPVQSTGPETLVLGHFKPFCYCMKVGAKLAKLLPITYMFAK
jgi:hypothetical protein